MASVEEKREEGGGGGVVERDLVAWLERNRVEDLHRYFTRHLANTAASQQV